MTPHSLERGAGACVAFGATLLGAYGVLFVLLLPIGQGAFDYPRLVVSPYWMPLALVALVGVISILAGVDAIDLYWRDLDIDLAVESIEHPEKYARSE